MSREEVAAALRNLQLSLDTLQRELEGTIQGLPNTRRDALPDTLAGVRRRLARFGREALQELNTFAQEAGLEPEVDDTDADGNNEAFDSQKAATRDSGDGTPTPFGGVQLKSLERRVSAMGGIPALGACVLPRMTPGQRPSLAVTASPAAVEIMRGRLGGSDATPLRKTSGDEEEGPAPSPLVQLRATPAQSRKGSATGAALGAAPPESELAAAITRRMSRLSSASPDKSAAMAAAAAAASTEVAEVACDS